MTTPDSASSRPPVRWPDIPAGRENLRLMVDYRASTPLWIRGRNVTDLAPLNLAPDLADALVAWQRHFDAHFSIDLWSWDEAAAADWHNCEGPRLYERLTRALPGADITLDMWDPAT